jgi:DNA-binding CsgD family transcriptional regulator
MGTAGIVRAASCVQTMHRGASTPQERFYRAISTVMRLPENNLLDLIYETAYEPELWTRVLERLADAVGGGAGWVSQISVVDGQGGDLDDPMCRVDMSWAQRFIDYYAAINPLNNVDDTRAYFRDWRPIVHTDEDWMPKEDLIRTEYYNDYLKPIDAHSTLWIRLEARDRDAATINIGGSIRRGRFDPKDLDIARAYQPHLIRAFKLGQKIGADRRRRRDIDALLDLSSSGVFLLDATGSVCYVNRRAERMLAGNVITVRDGKLRAVQPAASKKLEGLIAIAGAVDPAVRSGGSMALPTRDGAKPFSVLVTPVGRDRFAQLRVGASVCVCLTDLEGEGMLPEGALRDVLGLTPAETRLAQALFQGTSLQEAAVQFDLSPNTLRAQLSSIFGKTQTNRQAELIALLARLGRSQQS